VTQEVWAPTQIRRGHGALVPLPRDFKSARTASSEATRTHRYRVHLPPLAAHDPPPCPGIQVKNAHGHACRLPGVEVSNVLIMTMPVDACINLTPSRAPCFAEQQGGRFMGSPAVTPTRENDLPPENATVRARRSLETDNSNARSAGTSVMRFPV